jgi:hypothetical protein
LRNTCTDEFGVPELGREVWYATLGVVPVEMGAGEMSPSDTGAGEITDGVDVGSAGVTCEFASATVDAAITPVVEVVDDAPDAPPVKSVMVPRAVALSTTAGSAMRRKIEVRFVLT